MAWYLVTPVAVGGVKVMVTIPSPGVIPVMVGEVVEHVAAEHEEVELGAVSRQDEVEAAALFADASTHVTLRVSVPVPHVTEQLDHEPAFHW